VSAGKDLVESPEAGELAPISAEEQALINAAKAEIDTDRLVLPALKLTQSLTAEVQDGDVDAGVFINSLTGENFGDEVEVVISSIFTGRFYSDRETGQSYVAQGDTVPDNWPDEYAGQQFADLPDAEEQFRAAVQAKEKDWGKGPPISNTHNFVGRVVSDGEPGLPVRISLMRSGTKAADKLKTLIWAARAPWDRTFTLKAVKKVSNDRPYFAMEVSQGAVTPADYRQAAVTLAGEFKTAADAGGIELEGDEAPGEKPKPKEAPGAPKVT
jgi:hypothetical protein